MFRSRSLPRRRTAWRSAVGGAAALSLYLIPAAAQQPGRGRVTITPASTAEVRDWAPRIDSLRRSGDLRLRIRRDDPLAAGRAHERYDQYHRGVRVYGADVAEQLNGGQVVSAFGIVYEGIDIDPSPGIDADRAREVVEARAGVEIGRRPELVVFPRDSSYVLAWRVRAAAQGDVREYFVDARDGTIAFEFSDRKAQSAVGRGQGVLGDTKKISVSPSAGQFVTTDRLRPPAINTYDMRGDYLRTIRFLNDVIELSTNDLGTDSDNTWTDGATVDAHVYSGWTYDYFYKRFDRRGLDNRDLPLVSLVHPVRRSDFQQLFPLVPDFFLNAGYYGDGVMVLRRRPAGWIHRRRPDHRLLLGGARRGGPRAHPRGHGLLLEPDLSERIGRAERGVLGHHGHGGRVLLPAAGQREPARRLPDRRGCLPAGRHSLDVRPAGLRRSRSLLAPLHRPRGQRRRPHQLGHRQPRVLPRRRRRDESHVRPGGAGRRRRPTANRWNGCSTARSRRCCPRTRPSPWRAPRRSSRRAICSAPTARPNAPSRKPGPR